MRQEKIQRGSATLSLSDRIEIKKRVFGFTYKGKSGWKASVATFGIPAQKGTIKTFGAAASRTGDDTVGWGFLNYTSLREGDKVTGK